MLSKQDWQSSLDVQDACNLSGVVHSLARIVSKIREEKDCNGTDYVNQHPIVILFLSKLNDLAGMEQDSQAFSEAYQAVTARLDQLTD